MDESVSLLSKKVENLGLLSPEQLRAMATEGLARVMGDVGTDLVGVAVAVVRKVREGEPADVTLGAQWEAWGPGPTMAAILLPTAPQFIVALVQGGIQADAAGSTQ